MRPIDADALIEEINGSINQMTKVGIAVDGQYLWDLLNYAINNAPTIEPTEEFEWCHGCKEYDQDKHCCHRWSKQIRETVAELEEYYKPKRAEWLPDENGDFRCTNCGRKAEWEFFEDNFCPHCGADMREREGE